MIPIVNPYIFDRFCKMIEYQMDTDLYYEARKKYIKKALLNQKNIGKLDYFDDINITNYHNFLFCDNELSNVNLDNLNSQINYISNRWVNEYIISYFFRDSYYNFMVNLFQMVNYLGQTKKILVDSNHLKIYNQFRGLSNMSFSDKIAFFKKHVNCEYLEIFYDDMRKVKNDSYQVLVNSSIKLNHDSSIYNKDISNIKGIDIYYLKGEEFYAFVKTFAIQRNDKSNHYDHINLIDNSLGHSFSYISNNNIGTIDYLQKNVAILYDDIDFNNIMYVHHADLHSKKMATQDDYLSEKHNEILTPNALIAQTKNYNEVYIIGKLKPKALICYGEITSDDYDFAKRYNLSILLINNKKYERYETYDEDYLNDTYVL